MIEDVYTHLRKDYRQEQMGKVRIMGATEEAGEPAAKPALRLLG